MCFLTISAILGGVTAASIGASVGATGGLATAIGVGVMAAETIGVASALAGGVVSTIGGIQEAKQQAAQAEFQAKVADENAQLAAQSAEANQLQANQKRLALMNQMQQMQGNIRTDFAGRGVVLGAGTPNDYEADLADAYDMDRRNLEYDVATKSWQYNVEASNQRQQAKLFRAQAKATRSMIPGTVAGGLLSTAGNVAGSLMGGFSLMHGLKLGQVSETPGVNQAVWGGKQNYSKYMPSSF